MVKKVNWPRLIFAIALCQAAGIIGSLFTFSSIPTWYAALTKPSFNPPSWVFGPVWTILYTLMGISLYLILSKGLKKKEVKIAVNLFVWQLIANSLWSIIFFGMKNIPLALIEIIVLLLLVFTTIQKFYKINKTAAYLLIPYFFWGSFATFLTYSIWILNK
ncbi:MAG: tryptophan-rich sensory protein [Candidatus Woesebacteria bacterium]|nr:tryptophan-rich sensory protein [Candidatus Woesebacteria bacterium]